MTPAMHPIDGLPQAVTICDVGPRDGLQNEATHIDAATKVQFVQRLAAAGLTRIEAASFVHPRWVPQMADAEEVLAGIAGLDGVQVDVLVPNARGLGRAQASGATSIAVFASATETFAQRNLNRGLDEQWAMFHDVVGPARAAGLTVRGYLSMCFGDPWEGAVLIDQVVGCVRRLRDLGCDEISLGDTIGVGTPGHVRALVAALSEAGVPPDVLALHPHDTYGQALANTMAGLQAGITTIDASAGGLGGCPFARSATGNLATEDLVWMLDGLGVHSGVDLDTLVATSAWMATHLGRPSPSRVVRALVPTTEATT